ncbi:MAG: RnfABCDGE type electron transport complex subunit G [Oscillospiraceae bacterium]|nr:RnfABCDGE type electron transport complex subunit G [Oscillospiraceae bacterium]
MQENNGIKILKTGGILCAVTAVAALLLACVNNFTAPVIEQNMIEKTNNAMKSVMPEADSFEEIDFEPSEECESVNSVYEAKKDGETIGWCVSAGPNGYGGAIEMIVGVNGDMTVSGVDIISQSETAGLGAKATEPEFRMQYKGKGKIEKVVKSGAGDNEINAITSATITSKAVTKGVNESVNAAGSLSTGK